MKVASLLMLGLVGVIASAATRGKLTDALAPGSYSLKGIVADENSEPFACNFGRYTVKVKEKKGAELLVTLEGSGILVNSGFLNMNVGENPEITYHFPATANVVNGTKLSAYCNSQGQPGHAPITSFVKERP